MPEYRKEHNTKKITFSELESKMMDFNSKHPDKQDTATISGVIVFKPSNWPGKSYTIKERSYRVSNANRAFQHGKISNQLSGDCLDGKDLGVRLDWYKWEVDYCYMD